MMHTKGPWKEWHGDIVADGDKSSGYDDYVIAGIGKSYGSWSSVYSPVKITTPEGKANGRRIVACVNALEAFDIVAIEGGVVRELVEAVQGLGAMPEGYCFCHESRIGDDSKEHYPECRDIRTALAKLGATT